MDHQIPLHTLRLYYPLIWERDVRELLMGLGFVCVLEEKDRLVFAIPVEFPWRVMAEARVIRWDYEKGIYEVLMYANHAESGRARVGTVHYTESIKALRRYGVRVMQDLFLAVDTAEETTKCPTCGEGWLGWVGDPQDGTPRRPQVTCHACGWTGPVEGFAAVKELL